jgi:glucosylceramidase
MPASLLHPEFEMELVRDYLRPMIEQNGLDTKIWLLDHNYIHWNRAKWMLDDEGVKRTAAGVAFHYYEGCAEMLQRLREAHPDVEFHWTEGGPDLGESYQTDWCKWGQVFTEALTNGCRSVTGWNLALDEKGEPNIGPFSCAGLVTVDSQTNELSYSGQYRAFAHFGRYVRRGARAVGSQGCENGIYEHSGVNARLYHVAFENPGGQLVIVLTNPSKRQDVGLAAGDRYFRVSLPEDSVSTVVLDPED